MQNEQHHAHMLGLAPIVWLFCEAYYTWRMRRARWDDAPLIYTQWAKYDRLLRICQHR